MPPALLARFPDLDARIDRVPMPALEASSTDLRARVRDGRPTAALLPEAVRIIIDAERLYRGS